MIIEAIAEGTVRFPVLVEGSRRIVRLNGVLHVPQLAGNLISVPHLQDRGIMTRTAKGGRMLLELDGKLIGVAERIGRTYVLAGTNEYIADTAYRAEAITKTNDAMLWHRRFGHLSTQSLRKTHTAVADLKKPIAPLAEPCEPCSLNKSVRVINRKAPEHAAHPLDRIHSDIWGPYRVPALSGATYFITFTDDYSRKTWVYCVKTKDQLRTVFTEFRVRVELETSRKIIIIRCDNGSEYKSLEKLFGILYGIMFEYTTAYTPYQNAVPERLNAILVSLSRAMLTCAGLPVTLWGEAVIAVSYIRNRTPIGPQGLTPEEAYSGKKPSVSHLRAWGCVAYANIASPQRDGDKLAQNGLLTALVGYMPTSKQYRLYDPMGNRIVISTTPTFYEGRRLRLPGITSNEPRTIGFDPMEADPPPQGQQDTPAQPKDPSVALSGPGAKVQDAEGRGPALEEQGTQRHPSPTAPVAEVNDDESGAPSPTPQERSHLRAESPGDSSNEEHQALEDAEGSENEGAELQLLEDERAAQGAPVPADDPPL
jgi:hypothetical protein